MIEIKGLTYTYPERGIPSLQNVTLSIQEGEFLFLNGLSGSGKTTLLRSINALVPYFYGGRIKGRVLVDGLSTRDSWKEIRKRVGMVFQDPENQIVMSSVKQELVFTMENLGLLHLTIMERMEKWSSLLGLDNLLERRTAELSGGEKQRLVLAGVLCAEPPYLLLDEPASQLDAEGVKDLSGILKTLNRSGLTIVMSDHWDNSAFSAFMRSEEFFLQNGMEISKEELNNMLEGIPKRFEPLETGAPLLELEKVRAGYPSNPVIFDAGFSLHRGEIIGLVGRNGSGKSTLLKAIMGLPSVESEGKIVLSEKGISLENMSPARRSEHIAYLGQFPEAYLFNDTLEKEMEFTLKHIKKHIEAEVGQENIDAVLKTLDMDKYRQTNPRDLSTGEKERAALASVLVANQPILLLDEPTRGMDPLNRYGLASYIWRAAKNGNGVILATHDRELLAMLNAEIYEIRNGELRHGGGGRG